MNTTPKTLGEALANGYKNASKMTQNCYVSRKTIIDDSTPIRETKDGRLYYETPNWLSTRYSYRQYLTKSN